MKASASNASKVPLTAVHDKTEPVFGFFHSFCPVELSLKQGSVVLGNDATPSVLIAHFLTATGTISHLEVCHVSRIKLIISRVRHAMTVNRITI
jgi:hypothetical protein